MSATRTSNRLGLDQHLRDLCGISETTIDVRIRAAVSKRTLLPLKHYKCKRTFVSGLSSANERALDFAQRGDHIVAAEIALTSVAIFALVPSRRLKLLMPRRPVTRGSVTTRHQD